MKYLLALLMLFGLPFTNPDSRYLGTMNYDGYNQRDVTVHVQEKDGWATVTFYRVKFSSLMPLRVNMEIPGLKAEESRLSGTDIVPIAKGKRYEKYIVKNLSASTADGTLRLTATMGGKRLTYVGKELK